MNNPISFSLMELGNLIAKILHPKQNIQEITEKPEDHENFGESLLGQTSTMEEDSRISMKQSLHFPTCSGERGKAQESMRRIASWLATLTFSLCLLSVMFSKPLVQPQGPNSLWLAIIAMSNFTLFVCSASVMIVLGAMFSQMQITILLISFMALFIA